MKALGTPMTEAEDLLESTLRRLPRLSPDSMRYAAISGGITRIPEIGSATAFPTAPYSGKRWKCQALIGAVASVTTTVERLTSQKYRRIRRHQGKVAEVGLTR